MNEWNMTVITPVHLNWDNWFCLRAAYRADIFQELNSTFIAPQNSNLPKINTENIPGCFLKLLVNASAAILDKCINI